MDVMLDTRPPEGTSWLQAGRCCGSVHDHQAAIVLTKRSKWRYNQALVQNEPREMMKVTLKSILCWELICRCLAALQTN